MHYLGCLADPFPPRAPLLVAHLGAQKALAALLKPILVISLIVPHVVTNQLGDKLGFIFNKSLFFRNLIEPPCMLQENAEVAIIWMLTVSFLNNHRLVGSFRICSCGTSLLSSQTTCMFRLQMGEDSFCHDLVQSQPIRNRSDT